MENIKVYIRFKPREPKTESLLSYDTITISDSKTKEIFSFDYIIPPSQTNNELFENLIKQNIISLLKGINISIYAYGQTNSGKTYTIKGESKSNNGLIFLCIKEIFDLLNSEESNITKPLIKLSYCEIYNETVNDLIDNNKKNLEIRDSPKGSYINNLSEYILNNYGKALQILNKIENNKNISEAKLGEKLSKRNTIFKLNLEFGIKEKKYFSQLNLIDLSGSENISKVNGNINKSLITFNNIINKLSQNNKNFVNYKESKLTRLLYNSLGGNSKTTIFCSIIDDNEHYNENLNTLRFGMKARKIKTSIKENEINNEKKNTNKDKEKLALRNKIKLLEKIINDKKSKKENRNNNYNSNYKFMTASKNKNSSNKKLATLLSTVSKKDEQISNLEKEISMLKKLLMSNEKLGSEIGSFQNQQDWMNTQGDIYNDIYNMSSYKPSLNQRISNLSALRGSGSAIKNIYFNSPKIQRNQQSEFYSNSNIKQIEGFNNFKKNLCMTEMRPISEIPKNYFYSTIRKTAPQNNNFLFGSNIKAHIPELNINNNTNLDNITKNDFLIKENEELKRNINDLKKTYNDVVQSKEQQILLLNQNHDMSLENCEKLIKEAESNYMNLKTEYDQVKEKIKEKDDELNDLKQKNINKDTSINYYMNELNKMKDINYANEIEAKYNSLLEENIKLKQKEEEETSKLKEENDLIKKNIEMIETKYKEKCKELNDNQKKNNEEKKQIEKELQKYRIELKNFKNTQGKKGLNNKSNNNDNTNINNIDNDKIKEYEDQIDQLTKENNQYKNNLEQIEKSQIAEYQKLLDDSISKIAQLNKELIESKDKNKYLENALNIVEKTTRKNNLNLSSYNNEDNNNIGKDFLSKKRKMPKIYQDIIDNQQNNKNSNKETNLMTPNEENNNMPIMEFSNFEI
jgi:hypothetical protein